MGIVQLKTDLKLQIYLLGKQKFKKNKVKRGWIKPNHSCTTDSKEEIKDNINELV